MFRAIACVVALTTSLSAQQMVLDLNRTAQGPNGSSDPAHFTVVRAFGSPLVLFQATTVAEGTELWATNGALNHGRLVLDIRPGPASSTPDDLTLLGDVVYFSADDGVSGRELWRSDGTGAGTMRLLDIYPGATGSSPSDLYVVESTIFFAADDGVHGRELWKTDGTQQGTVLVRDIRSGPSSSSPGSFGSIYRSASPSLIFSADDGVTGREPWISDGTPGRTRRIADVRPGSASSSPNEFVPWFGGCVFVANDGVNGTELWYTLGDASSTLLTNDINPGPGGSAPRNLVSLRTPRGFAIMMSAYRPDVGRELYLRADQFDDEFVKDIRPGGNPSSPTELTVDGDHVYFAADDGVRGRELWRSDGTEAGTTLVFDCHPGPSSSSAGQLTMVASNLFFRAESAPGRIRLWRSGGTPATTHAVTNALHAGRPSWLTPFGLQVIYANDDPVYGREPHLGSPTGEAVLVDIEGSLTVGSSPVFLGKHRGRLMFHADDGQSGRELWSSDGTTAGTVRLGDLVGGPSGSTPLFLGASRTHFWFTVAEHTLGRELYVTDGTPQGTRLVRDVQPGSRSGLSGEPGVVLGDRLLFAADDGLFGNELWVSDGTPAGTQLLREIAQGTASSNPSGFVAVNGLVFFGADDGIHGREPWVTDGTTGGTRLVRDVDPGPGDGFPSTSAFGEHRGRFYFAGVDPRFGAELWTSDGTSNGTLQVVDIQVGTGSSGPRFFTSVGATMFFAAFRSGEGLELWSTRGSALTTALVADVFPGRTSGFAATTERMVAAGGLVFFPGWDGEPWRSDGTAAGTFRLADLYAGGASLFEPGQAPVMAAAGSGSNLVFRARDAAEDWELYTSDGTTQGTRRVTDIGPGTMGSSPGGFATLGDRLLFTADDGIHGQELWELPLSALGASHVEPYGTGCPGSAGTPQFSMRGEPRIGTAPFIIVQDAAPQTFGVLALGITRLDLPLEGACRLLVDPFVFVALTTNSSGIAALRVPLANEPEWIGISLFLQAAFADPGGTLFGAFSLSGGLQLVFGG